MPVLHIRALPQKNPGNNKIALKKTCLAIAQIYGCKPEQVWATWEEIKPGFYVEGNNEALEQPTESHPPICELICFEGKSSDQIERILTTTANVLSETLGIPGNIFITYHEAKSGQVVAGNGLIRKGSVVAGLK